MSTVNLCPRPLHLRNFNRTHTSTSRALFSPVARRASTTSKPRPVILLFSPAAYPCWASATACSCWLISLADTSPPPVDGANMALRSSKPSPVPPVINATSVSLRASTPHPRRLTRWITQPPSPLYAVLYGSPTALAQPCFQRVSTTC